MAINIPLNNSGARRFKVLLGEQVLTLRTFFNTLSDFWVLDISTQNGTPVANGLNLVAGINLLEWSPSLTTQYGQFRMTIDAKGDEALSSAELIWFSPGEFENLFEEVDTFSPPLNYDFDALFPRVVING